MVGLWLCVALAATSPELAEAVSRAVTIEVAQDGRFEAVSELDVLATMEVVADDQRRRGAGALTSQLADAYDARFVISVSVYSLAEETRVALVLRDAASGLIVARRDAGGVEQKAILEAVRHEVRALLPEAATLSEGRSTVFVSGARLAARKALLVGRARRPARVEPRSGLRFVLVPGGTFAFGCLQDDAACIGQRGKAVEETLPPFWIGQTEVTFASWDRCVRAGQCPDGAHSKAKASSFDFPVAGVTAAEAEAFCAFAGGRLPTSREWEYAARSGTANRHPWGNDPPTPRRVAMPTTDWLGLPVKAVPRRAGGFRAGATRWGLFDLAGGVAEWTSTGAGKAREVRGADLQTTSSMNIDPSTSWGALGFRCVVDVDGGQP